jgi:hypothetical protein
MHPKTQIIGKVRAEGKKPYTLDPTPYYLCSVLSCSSNLRLARDIE